MRWKKRLKKGLLWVFITFTGLNLLAGIHAYKLTHFTSGTAQRTKGPEQISLSEKLKVLCTGVVNPKPSNDQFPRLPYETIYLPGKEKLECWFIKGRQGQGTVAVFHGYAGDKSKMLQEAYAFNAMGMNVLLVDFSGSGGSTGSRTTLGYEEAMDILAACKFLTKNNKKDVYLFGQSMGAVAIMRALDQYDIKIEGAILACPFGSMLQAVENRFEIMGIPSFPFAELLVFWGGIQNGFWPFSHNTVEYARNISTPVLLLYGMKDQKVKWQEIQSIYCALGGEKQLKIFEGAGHESYCRKFPLAWKNSITNFIHEQNPQAHVVVD